MEAISAIEDHQIEPPPPSSTTLPGEDQIHPPYFSITQETLADLLQPHQTNISNSRSVLPPSALASILSGLQTDVHNGIPGGAADLYHRRTAFGSNLKFETSTGGTGEFDNDGDICKILMETIKDPTIVMLLCCAVLSLAIGIKRDGLEEGLRDGTLLFLAIFVLVNFGILGKFAKAKHRRWKLSSKAPKTMKVIDVIRGGRMLKIPVSEIVVGDVLSLRPGDQVPADGLLVLNQGHSIPTLDDDDTSPSTQHLSRLFSGSKVLQGDCRMLVTSVGKNTQLTKLMKSTTREEDEPNKLQKRVEKLNSVIEKVWACIFLLILVVQVIMCFAPKPHSNCCADHNPDPKGVKNTVEEIMNMVVKKRGGFRAYNSGVVAVLCILIFALRDGLPLGIFILLVLSSKKMRHYRKGLVNKLPDCATVGLVTAICSTTLNLEGSSQYHAKASSKIWMVNNDGDFSTCVKEISLDSMDHEVLNTLREGVFLTAFGPLKDFLLWWAKKYVKFDEEEMERSHSTLYREDFDDRSGVRLIRKENEDRQHHVYWKGDIEKILPMCSNYYEADGTMQTLDESKKAAIVETIANIISSSADILCCFALAYKQLHVEDEEEEDGDEQELIKQGLTLASLVALKNPYSPELRRSVKTCTEELGVQVMMMVEDEVKSARLMATHLGILNPDNQEHMNDGCIIEASQFCKCSELEQDRMVKHIRIMANSSPSDKLHMVQCLRRNGEVVAVIGKTTRDSPLLKEADIGLLTTQNRSEIAKDNAGMVVLDLNCTRGCGILTLGRNVCNSITSFLELQLTLTIVAYVVNLVVVLSTSEVPISPVQLLWFNLMMDVIGALALSASPMQTQPLVSAAGSVITNKLWRNVAVHSVFQVIVLLMLYFKGEQIIGIKREAMNPILFNCFAVCQVFMLVKYVAGSTLPPKMVETDRNLWLLLLAVVATGLAVQVAVVEISAAMLHNHKRRLSMKEWCTCITIASVSLVVDPVVNCFLSFFIGLGKACADWLIDLCSHVFSDMVIVLS